MRVAEAALSRAQLIPAAPADSPQGTAEPCSQGDTVSGKVHLGQEKKCTQGGDKTRKQV